MADGDTYWAERLLRRFPAGGRGLLGTLPTRIAFLAALWAVGMAGALLAGDVGPYLVNVSSTLTVFGMGLIVLVGTFLVPAKLHESLVLVRPLVNLDDDSFRDLLRGIERVCYSTIPIVLIAVGLFATISKGVQLLASPSAANLLTALFVFVNDILGATGLWMGVGIWLSIFLVSRSPMKLDVASSASGSFREITKLSLFFSVFYFVALSLSVVFPLALAPGTTIWGVLFSPVMGLVVVGAVIVLLPLFNIHSSLVSMKRRELASIETSFEELQSRFYALSVAQRPQQEGEATALMSRLFSLELRERRAKGAREWPVDVTFVSRLILLVLVPMIVRFIIWAMMGIT